MEAGGGRRKNRVRLGSIIRICLTLGIGIDASRV